MHITVKFTWSRDRQDPLTVGITRTIEIYDVARSKQAVSDAIRAYARGWIGKGCLNIVSITTPFYNDEYFCNIGHQKFHFDNRVRMGVVPQDQSRIGENPQ